MTKNIIFSILFLITGLFAFGQQTIKGTVSDESGLLPGVSVIEKGTNNGVVTDFDGNFTISVNSSDATLVLSYIGFQTKEYSASADLSNIVMIVDSDKLDEVVVTGYGSQTKKTLSGSVASISAEELENTVGANLGAGLSGKVSGLFIDASNNAPGENGKTAIRIRGTNTFNNAAALVVIDGIPNRAGGLQNINPNDIESISVLKDASAAIYGARAANGVVLVTTKRGKKGDAKVKISSYYGVQNLTAYPDMLSGAEFMDLINVLNIYKLPSAEWADAYANKGQNYTRPNGELFTPTWTTERIQQTGTDPWAYPDTYWYGEVLKDDAPISRTNLQISGGTDKVTYLASASMLNQAVNFKTDHDGFSQYDLRLNLDAKINDYLSMDVGLYTRQEDDERIHDGDFQSVFLQTQRQYPWFNAYWPTGELGVNGQVNNNLVATFKRMSGYDKRSTNFLQSNIGLNLKVPGVDGLSVRGLISYDRMSYDRKNFGKNYTLYTWDGVTKDSSGLIPDTYGWETPQLQQDRISLIDYSASLNISYEKDFGDHYLKLFGGITREETVQDYTSVFKKGFLTTELPHLSFGSGEGQLAQGTGYETARLNYYGRVNYNFQEKYLLELLFRYDGSYLFPEENRFGFFPGVSAGWVLSEESFFSDSFDFLDYFKVRASWGQLGNDSVAPFQFLSSYGLSNTSLDSVVQTAYETKVPNENITWETQTSQNIGIDLRALNNRLSLGFELFSNTREDILTIPNKTLPAYSGITPPAQNIGEFENNGYELSLGFNGESNSGLRYEFSLNYMDSNNKVVYIDEPELADRPWQRETGGVVGRPLLWKSAGIFRSQQEIDNATLDYSEVTSVLKPGDVRIVDVDGDGKITQADKTRVGASPFFDTQFGLNTNLRYKNFDFNMFWNGGTGAYNNIDWQFMSATGANMQRQIFDRAWSLSNTNASQPRVLDRGDAWWAQATDIFMVKRDYLRLKNIEIGYNVDESITGLIKAESIRLSLSGTNLITITDFDYDPETNQSGANVSEVRDAATSSMFPNAVGGGALNNGESYPSQKTVMAGIQITF